MKALKSTWNNIKASRLEGLAIKHLRNKNFDKAFSLIPNWEDYKFLKVDENPLIFQMFLDEESQEDFINKLSKLKYKEKIVNWEENTFGISPFALTVVNGELELAEKLEKLGGDIHQKLKNNNSLLHAIIIQKCQIEVLDFLIKRKIEINSKNSQGNTALHLACLIPNEEILKFLLKNRADANIKNSENLTCLDELVMHSTLKYFDIVDKYVRKENKEYLVHYSTKNNSTEILERILENERGNLFRKCPELKGSFPIHIAASIGNLNSLKVLIKKGADLDCQDQFGNTPLHLAIANKQMNSVENLVRAGANVNIENSQGMDVKAYAVATMTDKEIFRLLDGKI